MKCSKKKKPLIFLHVFVIQGETVRWLIEINSQNEQGEDDPNSKRGLDFRHNKSTIKGLFNIISK